MATNEEITAALVDALHNGRSGAVRIGAAKGLGIIGGEVARKELLDAFRAARTREEAGEIAEALGNATLR
ncbi:hypothetical protein [Paracidovorax citrulli]